MADFNKIVSDHFDGDGNIPASAINSLVTAIKTAVGNEFVDKERYKAKLNEIDTLKTEKQTAEDSAATAEKWKTKYESMKTELETVKADFDAKATRARKESAYREALKQAGVSEKRINAVVKASGDEIDSIELDENGKIKNQSELSDKIKSEWEDFIVVETVSGANTAHPPANNAEEKDPGEMSMEEYIKYRKGE